MHIHPFCLAAQAGIGVDEDERQSVQAGIDGGSVTSQKDIIVRAYNKGFAKAYIQSGSSIDIIGSVDNKTLPTASFYDTDAYARGNTSLVSKLGSISITTEDDAGADSVVSPESSIGGIINLGKTKGENTVDVENNIELQGSMDAYLHFTAETVSNASMTAQSIKNGGGFIASSSISATNALTRNVAIDVKDGSVIKANFGELNILASAGENDFINTYAEIDSNGAVALAKIDIDVTVNSTAKVNVGAAQIRNRFGTVNIQADSSENQLNSIANTDASGLGTSPYSEVTNTVNLTADVSIQMRVVDDENGRTITESDGKAIIEGTIVNIASFIGSLYINGQAYSKGSSLGADILALSDQNISLDANTYIGSADVTAHDRADITASVKPEYRPSNIRYYAAVQLNAIGKGQAKADGDVYAYSETIIGSKFIYRGAQITVTSYNFDEPRIECNLRHRGFIYHYKTDSQDYEGEHNATVMDGAKFYLGDAAGGMYVDIAYNGGQASNGIVVRQAGVRGSDYCNIGTDTITLKDLTNNLPGKAFLHGNVGEIIVYDQRSIHSAVITNSTELKLVVPAFYSDNRGYINPTVIVNGNAGSYTYKDPGFDDAGNAIRPSFTISNSSTGDVHIQNFLSLYDGTVTIEWTGETGGDLTAVPEVSNINSGDTNAPVWANKLNILNAASIGTAENPVNVWVISYDSNPAVIRVTAQGDIFLNVVPAVMSIDNTTSGNSDTPIRLEEVVSDSGNVNLTMDSVRNISMSANTMIVTMPVPGSLSYEAQQVVLKADSEINGMDVLNRYMNGYDVATGLYSYLLPNGTVFWMDAFGNVSRIEESETTMAVGDYTFNRDASGKVTSIGLNNGVHIDLATGNLYVDDNASFDVLFSSL